MESWGGNCRGSACKHTQPTLFLHTPPSPLALQQIHEGQHLGWQLLPARVQVLQKGAQHIAHVHPAEQLETGEKKILIFETSSKQEF